jgi:hypothetical protein
MPVAETPALAYERPFGEGLRRYASAVRPEKRVTAQAGVVQSLVEGLMQADGEQRPAVLQRLRQEAGRLSGLTDQDIIGILEHVILRLREAIPETLQEDDGAGMSA